MRRVPRILEKFSADALIVTASRDLYFHEDVRDRDADRLYSVAPSQEGSRPWEGVALVSLVSVAARNLSYSCERVERIKKGEILEIANIHAVSTHIAEKMVG